MRRFQGKEIGTKRLLTKTFEDNKMDDYVFCSFSNQGSARVCSFIKAPGISLQLAPGELAVESLLFW